MAYPILSQLRLLLIAFTTIYMREVMVVQVLLFFLSSVMMMSLLGFLRPVIKPVSHQIDEIVVVVVLDLLFLSSDPVLDADMRINLGWMLIGILSLSIVINQGSLLVKSIIILKSICKKKVVAYWTKKVK